MNPISRRSVLTAAAAGTLATAVTAVGAQAGETMPQPRRAGVGGTNPGPKNPARASQNPDLISPPATDHGVLPNLRFSFDDAHMRLDDGRLDPAGHGARARHLQERSPAWTCVSTPAACASCIGTRPPSGPTCSTAGAHHRGRRGGPTISSTTSASATSGTSPRASRTRSRVSSPDGCEFLLVFDDGELRRRQHLPAQRLAQAHAAGRARQELRRAGVEVRQHPRSERALHLPAAGAGAAQRRPLAGAEPSAAARSATA